MVRDELNIELRNNAADLYSCRKLTRQAALKMGFAGDDLWSIISAVFEACANALTHGANNGAASVHLHIRPHPDKFEAVVTDSGKGFSCPDNTPIPSPSSHRGRGIPLMREFMDEVAFERNGGMKVKLVKYLREKG